MRKRSVTRLITRSRPRTRRLANGASEAKRMTCVGGARVALPLFHEVDGGSIPTPTLQAKQLVFNRCSRIHAVALVKMWHSRLPNTQDGPWQFAFNAHHGGIT